MLMRTTSEGIHSSINLGYFELNDIPYLCRYTIKKYHSEKIVSDESWGHGRIELLPINTDGYSPIVLDDAENYRVLGVLRHVTSDLR